jgi:hypothetical protein
VGMPGVRESSGSVGDSLLSSSARIVILGDTMIPRLEVAVRDKLAQLEQGRDRASRGATSGNFRRRLACPVGHDQLARGPRSAPAGRLPGSGTCHRAGLFGQRQSTGLRGGEGFFVDAVVEG